MPLNVSNHAHMPCVGSAILWRRSSYESDQSVYFDEMNRSRSAKHYSPWKMDSLGGVALLLTCRSAFRKIPSPH